MDQTLQVLHNEMERAAIRNNYSEMLLLKLHQAKIENEEIVDETKSESDSDDEEEITHDLAAGQADDFSDTQSEASSVVSQTDEINRQPLETNLDTELNLTLGKKINYQSSSQGYIATGSPSKGDRTPATATNNYYSAEAEMAGEVVRLIEEREELLLKLKLEADRLNTIYLESDGSLSEQLPILMEPLFSLITAMQKATIDLSEGVGAWARIVHKEKLYLAKKAKKLNLFDSANDPRRHRKYCVLIAQKSAHDLYPASKELVSSSKRLSRGMEPPKTGIENKLVGIFDTREEAEKAFSEAFAAIPQEYILLADKMAVSKMIVGLRPCGNHYLVRSNGVHHDLKCEQCALQNEFKDAKQVIPHVYPEDILAQFIWRGENYMDKIWRDLDFIDGIHLLKKALPDEDFVSNPLLLSNATIVEVMESLKASRKLTDENGRAVTGEKDNELAGKDPLKNLRGEHEKLRDAIFSGKRENEIIADRKFQSLYKHSPFKRNLLDDLPPEMLVDPKITARLTDSTSKSKKQLSKGKSKTLSMTVKLESIYSSSRTSGSTGSKSSKKKSLHLSNTVPSLGTSTLLDSSTLLAIHNSSSTPLPSIISSAITSAPKINSATASINPLYSKLFDSDDIFNDSKSDQYRRKLQRCLYIIGQSTSRVESFRQRISDELQRSSAITPPFQQTNLPLSNSFSNGPTNTLTNTSSSNLLNTQTNSFQTGEIVKNKSTKKMSMVETFYTFRGAQFSTMQVRQPIANRVDDIFCRLDVGEFASFTKGRAIRSFYFQEEQARKGKEKIEERRKMQLLIKAALEVDIVHCDVPYILQLIAEAKLLRGSVLNLDIIQAEAHVKYYFNLIKYSIVVQAQYRGCRGTNFISFCFEILTLCASL